VKTISDGWWYVRRTLTLPETRCTNSSAVRIKFISLSVKQYSDRKNTRSGVINRARFRLGNGTDDWLCLVEWLAQRGAIKVVVALEKYSLTPVISRKFNMFMDRYKGITVQLVSQSSLNTEESACGLLDSSVTTYPLAAMFFVSAVSPSGSTRRIT